MGTWRGQGPGQRTPVLPCLHPPTALHFAVLLLLQDAPPSRPVKAHGLRGSPLLRQGKGTACRLPGLLQRLRFLRTSFPSD